MVGEGDNVAGVELVGGRVTPVIYHELENIYLTYIFYVYMLGGGAALLSEAEISPCFGGPAAACCAATLFQRILVGLCTLLWAI